MNSDIKAVPKFRIWKVEKSSINGTPNIGDCVSIGDHRYTVVSYFQSKTFGNIGLALAIQSCPEAPIISVELEVAS